MVSPALVRLSEVSAPGFPKETLAVAGEDSKSNVVIAAPARDVAVLTPSRSRIPRRGRMDDEPAKAKDAENGKWSGQISWMIGQGGR